MSSAHKHVPHNGKAEKLLGSLAGVVSAHVVREPSGDIVEIHILATADLHPKQVVRNVESALSAGLGISIDRRIVSVAQVRNGMESYRNGGAGGAPAGEGSGDASAGPAGTDREAQSGEPAVEAPDLPGGGGVRLEYVRCASRRDAENCTCEVVLRDTAGEYIGTGTGPDTASGRAEASARAVLDAIQLARPELRLQLDGAVISASRGRGFVIVSAHALLHRMSVPLAGAAALTRSPEEAAILAALQATNRWSA